MNRSEAHVFAREWLRLWNAHDLEGLLTHFTDDVVFASPKAAQILESSSGVICGKPELRAYWRKGLELSPNLRFELVSVYVGINTIVINYRNQDGRLVNEILLFAGPHVAEGHAAYLSEAEDSTGASTEP